MSRKKIDSKDLVLNLVVKSKNLKEYRKCFFYVEKCIEKNRKISPSVLEKLFNYFEPIETEEDYTKEIEKTLARFAHKRYYFCQSVINEYSILTHFGVFPSANKNNNLPPVKYDTKTLIVSVIKCLMRTENLGKTNEAVLENIYLTIDDYMFEYISSKAIQKKFSHYMRLALACYIATEIFNHRLTNTPPKNGKEYSAHELFQMGRFIFEKEIAEKVKCRSILPTHLKKKKASTK